MLCPIARKADVVRLVFGKGLLPYVIDAGVFPAMDLGMPYVQLDVPPNTTKGIAKFYSSVMGCPARIDSDSAHVAMAHNQELIYTETDKPLPEYDGHHIAVYVSDFSGPHKWLADRGLISEESDQFQYRFEKIVDPDSGDLLYEIEHEVRSLSHQMYRRPLVNRNPATNFFTYRQFGICCGFAPKAPTTPQIIELWASRPPFRRFLTING